MNCGAMGLFFNLTTGYYSADQHRTLEGGRWMGSSRRPPIASAIHIGLARLRDRTPPYLVTAGYYSVDQHRILEGEEHGWAVCAAHQLFAPLTNCWRA